MKKNSKSILLFFIFCALVLSCRKDKVVIEQPIEPVLVNPWANLQKVSLDVNGEIIDESGNPIADVLITSNDKTVKTDKNGVFVIKNSQQSPDFIHVKAEKYGYFNGIRVVRGSKNGQNQVKIILLKQNIVAKVKSSAGGEVTVDGVKIKFPANGFIDAAGKAYNADVSVAAKYLDPTKFETLLQMPGDLRAVSAKGEERILETFGMIFVELFDDNGNKLNLGNGGEAELSFESKTTNKPAEVPLWHFDEKLGAWREEGATTLINNRFVGKVKHFSVWNCDYPYEKVYCEGRLIDQNGDPLPNTSIGLDLPSGWGGHGTTDYNGFFKGNIPKNQPLELKVLSYGQGCSMNLFKKLVGPFSGNVNLNDVVVNILTSTNPKQAFDGVALDCSGAKLKNGYIRAKLIRSNGSHSYTNIFTDSLGVYKFTNFINPCNPTYSSVEITVYDLANNKESPTRNYVLNANNTNLGQVEVCQIISEFVDFKFNDSTFYLVPHLPITPIIQDSVTQGGGTKLLKFNFSFQKIKTLQVAIAVNANPPALGTYKMYHNYSFGLLGSNITNVAPANQNLTMTLTEYSAQSGGFIAGTISGTITLQNPTKTVNVSGSFRVKRN